MSAASLCRRRWRSSASCWGYSPGGRPEIGAGCLGAIVLVANWPFTVIAILPTNKRLMEMPLEQAGPESRKLIETWAALHAVRTALGALATAIFLWASLA